MGINYIFFIEIPDEVIHMELRSSISNNSLRNAVLKSVCCHRKHLR